MAHEEVPWERGVSNESHINPRTIQVMENENDQHDEQRRAIEELMPEIIQGISEKNGHFILFPCILGIFIYFYRFLFFFLALTHLPPFWSPLRPCWDGGSEPRGVEDH